MPLARFCSHCNTFHEDACPNAERRRYASSRQRQIRSTARWQRARADARRRDGNRCRGCGSTQGLAVHHVHTLEDHGDPFALNNLVTLCGSCHARKHGGMGGERKVSASHPAPVFRGTHIHDAPLIG
jgi:5-methylcytosine-specific restriction endonuclease McrA